LIAAEPTLDLQVQLLFELAQLAEEKLGNRPLAARCYQQMLDRAPSEPGALHSLARLLAEDGEERALAALLKTKIAQDPPDAEGALALLQEVLRARPDHPGALSALEEMMHSRAPIRAQAAALLEPILQQSGDSAKLLEALEAMAANESAPAKKVVLLHRIADLRAGALRLPDAFQAAAEALRLLPDDSAALEKSVALADGTDLGGPLAQLLEEILPRVADASQAVRVRLALAAALDGLWDAGRAIALSREVLSENPSNEQAFEMLTGLLERGQRHDELKDLIHARIAVAVEPRTRIDLHYRLADLLYRGKSNPIEAVPHYQAVLELDPAHVASLEALRAIHEKLGRQEDLAQVLAALAKLAQGPGSHPVAASAPA
jgi:tetratricopeptide (TPR) repeat protein